MFDNSNHDTVSDQSCQSDNTKNPNTEAGVANQSSIQNIMQDTKYTSLQKQDTTVAAVNQTANVLGNEQIGSVESGQNGGETVASARSVKNRQIDADQQSLRLAIADRAALLAACGAKVHRIGIGSYHWKRPNDPGPTWTWIIEGCHVELDDTVINSDDADYFGNEDCYLASVNRLVKDSEQLRRLLIVYQHDGWQLRLEELCRIGWRAVVGYVAIELAAGFRRGETLHEIVSTSNHSLDWWSAQSLAEVLDPSGEQFQSLLGAVWEHLQNPEHRQTVGLMAEKLAKRKSLEGEALQKLLTVQPLDWRIPPCGTIPKKPLPDAFAERGEGIAVADM